MSKNAKKRVRRTLYAQMNTAGTLDIFKRKVILGDNLNYLTDYLGMLLIDNDSIMNEIAKKPAKLSVTIEY